MCIRDSNNTIVHFPGSRELIGKIVKVYLEQSKGFYYMGRQLDAARDSLKAVSYTHLDVYKRQVQIC